MQIDEMEETARVLLANFTQDTDILTKNNKNISGLAYMIWALGHLPESEEKVNSIRIACECLFTLGYQAAMDDTKLDEDVWK